VGWSIDSSQTGELAASALDMAIRHRGAQQGVVIHCDHGVRPGFNRPSQHCFSD
jgi:transposase InsO family protein